MATKNYAVSNKARLLNITRQKEGLTFMQVLLRFIHERFLYRLSVSDYREHFFLKGGALLYAHEKFEARPTLDIDFMGERISRDRGNIKQAFREICSIPCEADGVKFDCGEDEVVVEDITLEREYNGIRVHMTAHLDTIVQPISMDVGFGDVIIPEAVNLDYPLLLDDMPEVNVAAYSLETVVAEKFQTMIDRAENNSRMKDFFDVYHILHGERICPSLLEEAVREVFANRGTEYQEHHPLFEHSFVDSNVRQAMWLTFLRKIKYKGTLGFDEVVSMITKVLKPIWDRMGENLV